MKKLRFLVLLLLLAAFMAGLSAYLLRQREPVYQGRPLSKWLEELEYSRLQDGRGSSAEALRHMGTNAMPTLVKMLRARDSELKLQLIRLARKQGLVRVGPFRFHPTPGLVRCRTAIAACELLGPSARSAIPELVALLRETEPQTGYAAARALGAIGAEAIPALVSELANENKETRLRAVMAMGAFPKGSTVLVPPLLRSLHDPGADVRNMATAALGRFGLEAAVVVPALAECLADPSSYVRMNAAQGLGGFGRLANSAVPALLQALEDENKEVCALAAIALKKVDGEAARKAGVK